VGGSSTGPCPDRSPPAQGLSRRGGNHKLREKKIRLTSQHRAGRWDSGNGVLGLSPPQCGGPCPACQTGLQEAELCRPGYLKGAKTLPEGLGPTWTIDHPLNPLGIPLPPSASTAGRILTAVGPRGSGPAPGPYVRAHFPAGSGASASP